MYKRFVLNRINVPIPKWSPMRKLNLKRFKVQLERIKLKSEEKVIHPMGGKAFDVILLGNSSKTTRVEALHR